ncbi:MAG TPA: TonB family protein [Saprospiraceae bacterium]|nr:TonB family protein [Saprospiraceae bacterium]
MIQYFIHVSLCWLVFYGIYYTFLRKETFFWINRTYLLSTLFLGILIPVLGPVVKEWFFSGSQSEVGIFYILSDSSRYWTEWVAEQPVSSEIPPTPWWKQILLFLYIAGVFTTGLKFIHGLLRIRSLYTGGNKTAKGNYILVETKHFHLPFSFFHWVFISQKLPLRKELETIIHHELTHVRNLHSLDVLVVELIHVIFWFHPLMPFYKKAIKEAHEYHADASVLRINNKKNYGQILLGQSTSGLEIALANHFFNSQIKNRITMMYKRPSGRRALVKYLVAVPAFILAILLFSNHTLLTGELESLDINLTQDTLPKNKESSISENVYMTHLFSEQGEIFTQVQRMPRFPGCEDINGTDQEKDACSKEKLMEYMYSELKYPLDDKEAGIEGIVVIQFVIDEFGRISGSKVVRNPGGGLGSEAERIVMNMNNLKDRWIPGMQENVPVKVMYTLPVRFSINESKMGVFNPVPPAPESPGSPPVPASFPPPPPPPPPISGEEIYVTAEKMPRFPGCEDDWLADSEKNECAKQKFLKYVYSNLKYPAHAREKGIEGMVIIEFIVEKDGSISQSRIVRDIGANCGDAALEVVNSMNSMDQKWIPGRQRNRLVRVMYTLPVRFQLQKETTEVDAKKKQEITEIQEVLNFISTASDSSSPSEIIINVSGELEKTKGEFPLFVVNGAVIIRSGGEGLNKINPGDIEKINVMKGEKAIEKYGYQALHGVIEVTLKKGVKYYPEENQQNIIDGGEKGMEIDWSHRETLQEMVYKVYPNPARESFTLEFVAEKSPVEIYIYSMQGKLLHKESHPDFNGRLATTIQYVNFANTQAIVAISHMGKIHHKRIIFAH